MSGSGGCWRSGGSSGVRVLAVPRSLGSTRSPRVHQLRWPMLPPDRLRVAPRGVRTHDSECRRPAPAIALSLWRNWTRLAGRRSPVATAPRMACSCTQWARPACSAARRARPAGRSGATSSSSPRLPELAGRASARAGDVAPRRAGTRTRQQRAWHERAGSWKKRTLPRSWRHWLGRWGGAPSTCSGCSAAASVCRPANTPMPSGSTVSNSPCGVAPP